jgi:glycosyltransferase involved in cell wall biosynthesis
MKQADLSVVLSEFTGADPEKLLPKRIKVVPNGIPDPCPACDREILPLRRVRLTVRRTLLAGETLSVADRQAAGSDAEVFKVLYLAHCTREKGLFDAVEAVLLANRKLAETRSPVSIQLLVAGAFLNEPERMEFDRLLANPELSAAIRYLGFVAEEQKWAAFRDAASFCFPTYYRNECQPVALLEAMAFALPVLTTAWRSIPELLPPDYPGLVGIRAPQQVADRLLSLMTSDIGLTLRRLFLERFTAASHLRKLAEAFHSVEAEVQPEVPPRLIPVIQR